MGIDSYRIITTRTGKVDSEGKKVYITRVIYNGREVDSIPAIKEIHDEIELGKKLLENDPPVGRFELILSGEDLKWLKQQRE